MGEAELEGPALTAPQMIDLVALVWFTLANQRLRRTLRSADEATIGYWADRLGIRDPFVIRLWRQIVSEQRTCVDALACELADYTCNPWPCYLFLKPEAMIQILEVMRDVIHPGPEAE